MIRVSSAHQRLRTAYVLVTVLIIAALLGCEAKPAAERGPSPQPSPTPSTPTPLQFRGTKTIYALVDRSTSYKRFTNQALDRLLEALPHVVAPGDQLIAAWIDSKSGDPDRTFVRDRVRPVECPSPPGEPLPPSTAGSGTTMEQQRQEREREEYLRKRQEWEVEVARMEKQCIDDQEKAVQEFMGRVAPQIEDNTLFFDDEGTRIYEAIYEASSYFASFDDPSNAVERKLLIFSDMQESRSSLRDEVPIDLNGVDIVVAMFFFEELGARERSKDEWTKLFRNAGAESVEFLVVDASTVEKVKELVLR